MFKRRAFKDLARALSVLALVLAASTCQAQTARRWEFNRSGDRQGWETPADKRGAVMGGSLWLTLAPDKTDPKEIADPDYQVWSGFWQKKFQADPILISSADLNLPAAKVTQVRLRVLNLSSLTDYYLHWRTRETGWGKAAAGLTDWGQPEQSRRCTMKADTKAWQEITCYLDEQWQGTIDQIEILSAQWMLRGDLWIDWIELGKGPPESTRSRPDIASPRVIPTVTVPGISRQAFAWKSAIYIEGAEDFDTLNEGLRHGLIWDLVSRFHTGSMDEPMMRPLSRHLGELLLIRRQYADLLFQGRFSAAPGFSDPTAATVIGDQEVIRYSVFVPMDAKSSARAVVVVNVGDKDESAKVSIGGKDGQKVTISAPFQPDRAAVLPLQLNVPPRRATVVIAR